MLVKYKKCHITFELFWLFEGEDFLSKVWTPGEIVINYETNYEERLLILISYFALSGMNFPSHRVPDSTELSINRYSECTPVKRRNCFVPQHVLRHLAWSQQTVLQSWSWIHELWKANCRSLSFLSLLSQTNCGRIKVARYLKTNDLSISCSNFKLFPKICSWGEMKKTGISLYTIYQMQPANPEPWKIFLCQIHLIVQMARQVSWQLFYWGGL